MNAVHLLRHFVAALIYRTEKVIATAPPDFGAFSAGHGVRTPAEILAHVGDVMTWGKGRITGEPRPDHTPGTWPEEVARFRAITSALNQALADWNNAAPEAAQRLLQGPLADAMTHAGQLAMLSRMAGAPIPRENFYEAPIAAEQEKTASEH